MSFLRTCWVVRSIYECFGSSVMEDIAVFTSKQKTKNSLQRFMDAGEDLKKVREFNSDINETLLQLHVRVFFSSWLL